MTCVTMSSRSSARAARRSTSLFVSACPTKSHGPAARNPVCRDGSPHPSGGSTSPAIWSGEEASRTEVAIERSNHPIAIRPRVVAAHVSLEAVRVGVVGDVEPVPRPTLAVVRRREALVHQFLVRVGIVVSHERLDPSGVGGSPSRSNDSRRISVRRSASGDGRSPSFSESRQHESIDVVSRPCSVADRGHSRACHRLPCPVRSPLVRIWLEVTGWPLRPGIDPLRTAVACAAVSGSPFGGMRTAGSTETTRRRSSLSPLFPGTIPDPRPLPPEPVPWHKAQAALLLVGPVAGETSIAENRVDVFTGRRVVRSRH